MMIMNKEEYESPYCDVCGTCGYIGCCGIRNFISEHIQGKTNCKNEDLIINESIDLCDYKDRVFEENKQLKNIINELEKHLKKQMEYYKLDTDYYVEYKLTLDKLKSLKEGKNNE